MITTIIRECTLFGGSFGCSLSSGFLLRLMETKRRPINIFRLTVKPPLGILQKRYALGEITKEAYLEAKETIDAKKQLKRNEGQDL